MTETSMNVVNEALKELRSEFDKKSQDLGKIEKLEAILDKHEEANQKATKESLEIKNKADEIAAKCDSLEAELKRSSLGGEEADEKKAELKAFENYFVKGEKGLNEADLKALRTDVNVDGGYLVPIEQSNEIIKKITEVSDVRSLAKVRTLNAKTLRLSTRSALLTGGWAGECETILDSCSQYGREELVAKKLAVSCAITVEELQDANVNMVNEINSDVMEAFAQLEGRAFVNGDSAKKPEGFMVNPDITSINSGSGSAITFDSLIALTGELKTGYNPVYAMNRRTLAAIRQLKDGAGNYVWQAGNLGAGIPNAINGFSYAVLEDMPDIGAGNFPVIFGDFFRGYLIGDRAGLSVIRDEVSLKKEGKVEYTFMKRVDGQVVQPEAFKKLQIAA